MSDTGKAKKLVIEFVTFMDTDGKQNDEESLVQMCGECADDISLSQFLIRDSWRKIYGQEDSEGDLELRIDNAMLLFGAWLASRRRA